jgi:hypothetical protein
MINSERCQESMKIQKRRGSREKERSKNKKTNVN